MRFDVDEIASICSGEILVAGRPNAWVTSLSWDSRYLEHDCLFVALEGERVDGHDYCLSAAQGGAAALLVSRSLDEELLGRLSACGCAVVLVEDGYAALAALAGAWRARLKGRVLAITGSSGKTTTKNLVRDVLSAAGSTRATQGNQNNELGVPATILAADEDTDYIVVEMGMRGEGQLAQLCKFVKPDWALVTNVGTSHMELLGSREAIARAKAEPFTFLPKGGCAFINASDPFASSLVEYGSLSSCREGEERGVSIVYFDGSGSPSGSGDSGVQPVVYASDISFDEEANPRFCLHVGDEFAICHLPMPGAHSVHNAVAAAAVGFAAHLGIGQIVAALEGSVAEQGRQSVLHPGNGIVIVDDSYNANPDSMAASLEAFAKRDVAGRRIAVLGDMLELGDFAQEGHRRMGQLAARSKLDCLVCVGQLAAGIYSAALEAGMPIGSLFHVQNAQEALECVEALMQPGDCVLAKASHSVGLDKLVEGLESFGV